MADNCTHISAECPVELSTYGYYPSVAGNGLLAGIFSLCALAQIVLVIRYRVKLYSTLVFFGCLGEVIGYIGRIMLHNNPWSDVSMIINVLLLIVSPSFLAAALYITLRQMVQYYGPEHSLLKPQLYTWLFISCDAIGFVMQLVGGGISGSDDPSTTRLGNDIMIAGITFQAVTMAVAGTLAIVFAVRFGRSQSWLFVRPFSRLGRVRAFFLLCAVSAFVAVLVRCIYR